VLCDLKELVTVVWRVDVSCEVTVLVALIDDDFEIKQIDAIINAV